MILLFSYIRILYNHEYIAYIQVVSFLLYYILVRSFSIFLFDVKKNWVNKESQVFLKKNRFQEFLDIYTTYVLYIYVYSFQMPTAFLIIHLNWKNIFCKYDFKFKLCKLEIVNKALIVSHININLMLLNLWMFFLNYWC